MTHTDREVLLWKKARAHYAWVDQAVLLAMVIISIFTGLICRGMVHDGAGELLILAIGVALWIPLTAFVVNYTDRRVQRWTRHRYRQLRTQSGERNIDRAQLKLRERIDAILSKHGGNQ